jgi:hypothetical protein
MILQACARAGHRWGQRQLGPVQRIHLIILQILNFNTAMTALRHLVKEPIKASAYCRARMRLPLEALEALLVQSSAVMRRAAGPVVPLWCGLKPYLVDGSSTITPDASSSQKAFGQPTGQKAGNRAGTKGITTLLDPAPYPKQKIIELYGVRRRVETYFAELKTTLKMRTIKSRTARGVQKELVVYALAYNLVHVVMLQAAQRQRTMPDRIGFLDTLRWLLSASPGEALPALLVNPLRTGRHEPKVIKDLQDTYRKMTRPPKQLRKEVKKQAVTA